MNVVLRAPVLHKITQEEFHRARERGVFPDDADLELIDGVLLEMPDDGFRTIDWNAAINYWLVRSLPRPPYTIVPDKSLRLMEFWTPKPDFYIHAERSAAEVTPQNLLLVIEVSDTTIPHDRDVKAPAYAKAGVREHWRIECETAEVFLYRLRPEGGYGAPRVVAHDQLAEALLIPELKLRLADLGLAPGTGGAAQT